MAELIYATSEPAAVAAAVNYQAEQVGVTQAWEAYRDAAGQEFPVVPRLHAAHGLVLGFDVLPGVEPPPGWVAADHWNGYIPDVSTEAGAAHQRQIDNLPAASIFDPSTIGVPPVIAHPVGVGFVQWFAPTFMISDEKDTVFALWATRAIKPTIDLTLKLSGRGWAEVPRSVWYARIEAHEAAQEAARFAEQIAKQIRGDD